MYATDLEITGMHTLNYLAELLNLFLGFQLHIKNMDNPIERYNREIKRNNAARGAFQTSEGSESTTSLQNIIYNHITPHETLNEKTPAQAAGIDLLLGQNKLLNLIKLARRLEMMIR